MRIVKSVVLTCGLFAGLLLADLAWSQPTPAAERRPFLLGGIQLNEDDHERWAASLIQAGMNAVQVTVYAHQGAWHSPNLWYAEEEPSVLAEIRAARRNGLQVVLILRVALDHNDPANRFLWHGLIYPRSDAELAEWFRRYGDFVVHWARIARAEGIEVLGLASEMNSLLATLPVEEIPDLPAYYLDDAKQEELRELVEEHRHLFGDADRMAMGAGDFISLDNFLSQRNSFERRWAQAYIFAEPGVDGEPAEAVQVEKINLRRRRLEGHWRGLISRVRAVYPGHLTIAANFDNYHEVSFWDDLDFIGINAYFSLRPTLETPLREASLAESWRHVFADIEAFRKTHDLDQPVVFTELGYTGRRGVTVAPWSSSGFVPMWDDDRGDSILLWTAQPIELEERALAVRSLVSAWIEDDLPLAGALYWKLSSREELGRYEPFMLYLGADSEDPLLPAFTRFSRYVRPLDPVGDGAYGRWASAIVQGDVESLERLRKPRGVDVPPGRPPLLHLAVQQANGDALRKLSKRRGAVKARDDAGFLPLHWACYQQDPSLVAALLPAESVSWQDDSSETPLTKCARLDNTGVMRELLRHRPDLADFGEGSTPLSLAADLASVEMVDLLIRHGAGAGQGDAEGVAPLHAAARRGDAAIVERMLEATTADLEDAGGNRPASYAAYYGKPDAFRLLFRAETAREKNSDGQSLLHLAAHGGDVEIVGKLLRHGLEVDAVDREGRTPLHFAIQKTHREAARLLIERGASINHGDRDGRTAAHLAAEKDDPQLLQLVLARSPKLDAAGFGGNTPLHYAAGWGRLTNVRLLLAAGAAPGARNDLGQTALEVAEESGRKRVVELLRGYATVSGSTVASESEDPRS